MFTPGIPALSWNAINNQATRSMRPRHILTTSGGARSRECFRCGTFVVLVHYPEPLRQVVNGSASCGSPKTTLLGLRVPRERNVGAGIDFDCIYGLSVVMGLLKKRASPSCGPAPVWLDCGLCCLNWKSNHGRRRGGPWVPNGFGLRSVYSTTTVSRPGTRYRSIISQLSSIPSPGPFGG